MSLSAWEQQVLDSIKNELAGSDPDLAALLSEFNRLASGEEMPEREKIRAGSRRARLPLRSTRRLLRFQWAVLVLSLLTTAAVIAVALVLSVGGNGNGHPGPCTETVAMVCAGPAPRHSQGSPSHNATSGQAPHQVAGIPQAGP